MSSNIISEVDALVDEIQSAYEAANSLYLRAERAILNKIRWDRVELQQTTWWAVPVSKARVSDRLDAEYFQPKYDNLAAHLGEIGDVKNLGDITSYVERGFQPTYVENGEVIVVNSQHLGRYLLNVEATERTDKNFWDDNKRARLQKNDVLVYSTGAYVGRTNFWLEKTDGVASNHVTIIRSESSCNPLYLAVFLNSPVGLLQAEKWASGSGQRELYAQDIASFLVYLPSEQFQQRVADFVKQSYKARQKAKALLEKAKTKVEALVKGRED